MAGFGNTPRSELIKLANVNRLRAATIETDRKENCILFKVQYQNGRGGIYRIPAAHAIMHAEYIASAAAKRAWSPLAPAPLPISDIDRNQKQDLPSAGTVQGGHVLTLDDAVVLVLGFENNLGLCLRVGRNHAAWFAAEVLHARDQGLLTV